MAYRTTKSEKLMERAERLIPGGVNSPVRAFGAVGGTPPFIARGEGARMWDADGNEYIDMVSSWGPLIHGHAPKHVVEAIIRAAAKGTSYGAPTAGEVELAGMVAEVFPSVEKVRLVNSGTEATMSALRAARGFTGRDKIVKFIGCYHGHADGLLVQAGSGALTLGMPSSPGVPAAYAGETLLAEYNDLPSVERLFKKQGKKIAALIVEPVAGNMGVVPPAAGFLKGLRKLTKDNGAVLIFDEIITGFRIARGGAQERYGIRADMTCLGKIIGGGLPVGAYGGRAEIMDRMSPVGPVYQAGTLSGNPIAVAAGIATMKSLRGKGVYAKLEKLAASLESGVAKAAAGAGIVLSINRVGSMQTWFFAEGPVSCYHSATSADTDRYADFFHGMLRRGVYLPPSQFEAIFVSTAHKQSDIDHVVGCARDVFAEMASRACRLM